MNNPNPLVPQGSLLEQQKSKSKSNLFIAVFAILTLHVVLVGGMLIAGCKRGDKESKLASNESTNTLPPFDTNFLSNLPAPDTNTPPATPAANVAAPPVVAPTLPPVTPIAAPETTAGTTEYKVAKGDTFAKIAKDHKVTVAAMTKANPGVDSRKLKVGQVLQLPPPPSAASTTTPVLPGAMEPVVAAASGQASYVVKPGDNLTRIAKKNGTTATALRAANSLKTDQLHVGQKLKLPAAKAAAKAPSASAPMEAPMVPPANPSGTSIPAGGGRI